VNARWALVAAALVCGGRLGAEEAAAAAPASVSATTPVAGSAAAGVSAPSPSGTPTALSSPTAVSAPVPAAASATAAVTEKTGAPESEGPKHRSRQGADDEPMVVPVVWDRSGVELTLGATALSVFNGSPLSYTPFEIGWRFANGLHVRSGFDLFYYNGLDTDVKQPQQGVQLYTYEMQNWRSSVLYTVPVPGHLRPIAGLSLEIVQGSRKLAGLNADPSTQSSWGFLGPGAIAGAEWRLTPHWAVEMLGRYTFSFGAPGTVSALGLNGTYLF
jgi:hypothetical protein